MLTEEMVGLIGAFSAGSVATVDDHGRPMVSPKATFVVIDNERLAFGDLRSPNTVANLRARPAIEVVFTDILARKAVRVTGTAEVVPVEGSLRIRFEERLSHLLDDMKNLVVIDVTGAEMILSPAYDYGGTADVLRRANLDRLIEHVHGRPESVLDNDLGQPIGGPITPPAPVPPPSTTMVGRYCRLEALDRAVHGSQLDQAYRAAPDDADWTYLPYGPWSDEAAFGRWLGQVENQADPMFFSIIDLEAGQDAAVAAGLASFLRVDPAAASIEVGHIHLARSLQRTRAATEAMFLLMGRAFESGYRRYEWKCDALNEPSRLAAARLGFRYEGTFRQATHYKNRNRDTAWFSIIDTEWPALAAEYRRWLDPGNFDVDGRQRSALDCRR